MDRSWRLVPLVSSPQKGGGVGILWIAFMTPHLEENHKGNAARKNQWAGLDT
jgi:hypothetical protein